MKAIKKFFGIALMGLCALSVGSCADENDWDVESAFDRLFGVGEEDIDVTPGETTATVTFSSMTATEDTLYFVIEVSTDSLYDDIPMGGKNSIVFGQDKSIKNSPCELTGLQSNTRYFLRIKTMSDTKAESRWVYYNDGSSFKTKTEQIFNPVETADRGDTSVRLTWSPAGTDVTHILVLGPDGSEVQRIDLTPEAIAGGEYTVTGLNPSTTYTFQIYNGETIRGSLTVTTMASMPEADLKYSLPADVTVLSQDIIDQIAEEAKTKAADPTNYSVTIGISGGSQIDVNGTDPDTGDPTSITIPDGMSVTFFGMAGGDAPVLNMVKSLDIAGSHAYIRFDNVQLVDGGCQYFINQSDAATIGSDLTFSNCTIKDFERSLIRLQGSNTMTIGEVKIDNCVATNMSHGNGYSVLYWNKSNFTVNKVSITNTTFDTYQRSLIEIGSSNTGEISISDCTIYNGPASGRYIIDGNGCPMLNVELNNTIFALSPEPDGSGKTCNGIRGAANTTVNNVYFTSDFILSGSAFEPTVQLEEDASEVFADPENGDFTIISKDVENAGDPRWIPAD